jgi:hypothetical protein
LPVPSSDGLSAIHGTGFNPVRFANSLAEPDQIPFRQSFAPVLVTEFSRSDVNAALVTARRIHLLAQVRLLPIGTDPPLRLLTAETCLNVGLLR